MTQWLDTQARRELWRRRRDSNLRRLAGVSRAGACCRNPERSRRTQVDSEQEPEIANSNNWRRRRDSNPRGPCEPNGFQDRRFQPLTHSSAAIVSREEGFWRRRLTIRGPEPGRWT